MWMPFVISALLAWGILVVILRTPWVKVFLDTPDRRKMHQRLVPRMGGVGVILGSVLVLVADGLSPLDAMLSLGGLTFVFIGMLDDSSLPFYLQQWTAQQKHHGGAKARKLHKFELKVRYKLALEIALAVIVVGWLGLAPDVLRFGNSTMDISAVSFPLTCLWLIGVMNAFNLIDGIDGLCGGVAALSLLAIAGLGLLVGMPAVSLAALVVAGASLGFLVLNVSPARIFMGDMGALFVGFAVGLLGLQLLQNDRVPMNFLVLLFLGGLPVFDELVAIVRRYGDVPAGSPLVARLRRIVGPDSNHIHHRMLFLGLGHFRAAAVLYAVQALFLLGAVLLVVVPFNLQVWVVLYLAMNVALFYLPAYNRVRLNLLRLGLYRAFQGLNELPWRVGIVCASPELSDSIACQHRLPFEFFHFNREELALRPSVSLHAVLLEQLPGESIDELLSYAVYFWENWNMPMALVVANHAVSAASLKEHPLWQRLDKRVSVYNRPLYIWPLLLELIDQLERCHVARPSAADGRVAHTGNGAL